MASLLGLFCENETTQILQQSLNSTAFPLVNECIQHTWLTYIPSLYLLTFFPLLLYDLHTSPNGQLKCQSPITYRLILCPVLAIITGVMLLNGIHEKYSIDSDSNGSHLFGLVLLNLTVWLSLLLMIACRNRGVATSGVLFIYYALLVICGLPELFAHLHNLHIGLKANVHCHLFLIYYLFVFLILCLSCFADRLDHSDKETNACPELYTSFLNQLTFHWFTSFTIRGYFKGLQLTDMWNLNERDQAPRLVDEFERNYAESIQSANRKNKQKRKPKKKKECLPVNGATEEQPLKLDTEPEQKEELPSVFWALARTFKLNLLAGALFKFAYDIVQFSFPQLLKMLISFVEKGTEPIWYGIFVAVSILSLGLIQSLVLHQYFHLMFRTGMNIRSVLTAAVYKKAINLSNKSRKNRTVGSMVNLLAVDVQKFQDITTYAVLIWSAPMQMLLALFFLWRLLGFCVLIGLVILVVLIPINSWISSMTRQCQTEQLECKDRRLRLISEVMNGIKMIKLYGWEKRMKERILEERQKEIQVLRRYAFLQTVTSFTWSCAPFLVAVMTFGIYVLVDPENNVLTPQITFVALSLFNILRFPMAVGMIVFTQVIQFSVSNKRVKEFLAADELEPLCLRNSDPQIDFSIVLENASFAWEKDGQTILHDLNARIHKGMLVAVIGRIGSGKSSLLQALIGEMHRCEGWSALNGQVAYVPQQSWIQNMSVRDNILFGRTYKEGFYETVISGCVLSPDMAALQNGDLTEIGEKGVNISGGQKARVSLARSVYADADVYLLDNPLASVDAHVGRSIFENVITGMLANKTRILVTHSLAYLKHCDQIIVMKDGRFSEIGGYEELMQKSGEFSQILKEFLMEEAKNRGRSISFGEDAVEAKEVLAKLEQIIPDEKEPPGNELKPPDDKSTNHLSPNGNTPANSTLNQTSSITTKTNQQAGKTTTTTNPGGRLIEGESVETGKVKWSVYLAYIRAIGFAVCAFFIIIFLLSSALGIKSNLWLSDWTDEALRHQKSLLENGTSEVREEGMSIYSRLGIYTLLGLGQIVFVCLATVLVMLGMVRASWLLHESMLNGVLRSPMSFFDITPLGRILNRFAKDMELVDSRLPGNVLNFAGSIIQALAILCVPIIATPLVIVPFIVILIFYVILTDETQMDIVVPSNVIMLLRNLTWMIEIFSILCIVTPAMFVALFLIGLLCLRVVIFYLSTSRQLNRLVAITRSPIYSHFGESIQGASSIRAYGCMDRFIQASQERVDQNLKVYYPSIVANRWLSIRLELIGHLIVFCSALFAVLFRNVDHVTAGLIGLSVSYAQNVTQTLNWAVRTSSELETNIVSIERIQEYADAKTEKQVNGTEGEIIISESELWPTAGEIRFENLSMRYRENTEEILHDINLHIQPGEKIGIIGRTGSGKTTLALSLLRIVEPSAGRILIDNANIAHVKLDTIRARLTVVPQDPVLFSGTIRFNLDPCDVFSEPALWEAIQLVHMGGFVESLPDQLNHQITEGGSNLSVGQRQLICLARALLRKPKILVLDEASASVDLETDSLIHRTIKEQFDGTTVLTIAHRLTFMFECDRILAMDAGRVVEFDTPQALWADETSVFRQLGNESEVKLQNVKSQQTPNIEVTVAEMNSNEKE